MLRQDDINEPAQWNVLDPRDQEADDPFQIKGVGVNKASPTPCSTMDANYTSHARVAPNGPHDKVVRQSHRDKLELAATHAMCSALEEAPLLSLTSTALTCQRRHFFQFFNLRLKLYLSASLLGHAS